MQIVALGRFWPALLWYEKNTKRYLKWATKKRAPGWLGYIGDEILPSYMGIIINHYKDPY